MLGDSINLRGKRLHMSSIRIRTCQAQDVTVISNAFLDRFLPRANGDFIKVYLYLLRTAGTGEHTITLCSVADTLECTENDVRRALKYWEKEQILTLKRDEMGEVCEIAFVSCAPEKPEENVESAAAEAVSDSAPARIEPFSDEVTAEEMAEGQIPPISLIVTKDDLAPVREKAPEAVSPRPCPSDITTARMAELGTQDEIRELFFIAQQYLGKPLTRGEMQHICFYYDELHFSADLIDYLLEYCIGHNHKSFRYIDKVAMNWQEQGITSVRDARIAVGSYHKEYYDILRCLGINNHHPVEGEIRIMKKWIETFHFPMEIIKEACERTVLGASKPTLHYTDSILTSWYRNGVKTLADIERLDREHTIEQANEKAKRTPARQRRTSSSAAANGYSDYGEHAYDYDSLERQLANSANN